MIVLIIRRVPTKLHNMLKERAALNRCSMNQELLALLEEALIGGRWVTAEPPAPFTGRFLIDDDWIQTAREEGRA